MRAVTRERKTICFPEARGSLGLGMEPGGLNAERVRALHPGREGSLTRNLPSIEPCGGDWLRPILVADGQPMALLPQAARRGG